MTTLEPQWSLRTRLIAFLVVCLGAVAFAFVPITTWLGVKVVATFSDFGAQIWDKTGSNRMWQVWWRTRNAIFETGHDTIVTCGFVALFVVFVLAGLSCVWILLSLPTSEPATHE